MLKRLRCYVTRHTHLWRFLGVIVPIVATILVYVAIGVARGIEAAVEAFFLTIFAVFVLAAVWVLVVAIWQATAPDAREG